jgi:hypothetical protein
MGEIRNELMIRKSERRRSSGRCNDNTEGNVKEIGSQNMDLIQVAHNTAQPLSNTIINHQFQQTAVNFLSS